MRVDLNDIDAIIFDLGGVILNLDYNLTIEAFKKLGAKNFEALYSQANQDGVFDAYETGKMSSEEFTEYLATQLPAKTEKTAIISAWNAMLLNVPENRIELLKKLANSYKIYLFSNTNEIHYKAFRATLNSDFQNHNLLEETFIQCYYSHQGGKRKPNKEAFLQVLMDHDLTAERTLFIDDSIQHIEGANKLGIRTYHLEAEDIIDIFDSAKSN